MKQVQMHRAMTALGTDLGKSEMLEHKAMGLGGEPRKTEEMDWGQIVYVKLRSLNNLVKTTTITKGSPRVFKQYKDISDSFS